MSEYLTHIAVADDCARLASASPAVCGPFRDVIERHSDIVRLGSISRWGDQMTVDGFRRSRDNWPNRKEGDSSEEVLAFLIGWRTHNAADRCWKPRHREINAEWYAAQAAGEDPPPPCDARIYNDLMVFREVYGNGEYEPADPALYDLFLGAHPAGGAVCVDQTDSLMLGVFQRTLLGLQSWKDDGEDLDAWQEKFDERFQTFRIPLWRYSEVFRTPNPAYVKRFVLDNNFYDRQDPLIRLARSVQHGAPDRTIDLSEAVAAAESQSEYAQVLRKGYLYILASSEFFESKIDEHELHRRLDLGRGHT